MAGRLRIREIYRSIQGESSWAGWPCVFVRLAGCDLRCSWCDSAYAFSGGAPMEGEEVLARVEDLAEAPSREGRRSLPLVEITGGEPLLQEGVRPLMGSLCDAFETVLLETSGAHSIAGIDPRVRRIVDIKCPGSGESHRMLWENVRELRPSDEAKFVIATLEDYRWARDAVSRHGLAGRCTVLFSLAEPLAPSQLHPQLKPAPRDPLGRRELAERILRDRLPVRFQLQMHKLVWPPDQPGV